MRGRGFLVDLERCVGCGACVLACRLENDPPGGGSWRRVVDVNRRRAGGPTYFLSVACHHCERPACLRACPSGAFEQSPDGVVLHRAERCLGCRYCEMACPFGAPRYCSESGVVGKCHLCSHRLDRGEEAACVAACPTAALALLPVEDCDSSYAETEPPGFADPAACRPRTRFRPPRHGAREDLFRRLQEALRP